MIKRAILLAVALAGCGGGSEPPVPGRYTGLTWTCETPPCADFENILLTSTDLEIRAADALFCHDDVSGTGVAGFPLDANGEFRGVLGDRVRDLAVMDDGGNVAGTYAVTEAGTVNRWTFTATPGGPGCAHL